MTLVSWFKRFRSRSASHKEIAVQVNDVGTVLAQRGLVKEAISNFTCAVNLNPKVSHYWSNLGNALNLSGDSKAACACFEKGSTLEGASAQLYDNWAGALAHRGRLQEALVAEKKAIVLDPNWPTAITNLGNVYRDMGDVNAALMNLNASINMDPSSHLNASARLYAMNFVSGVAPEEVAKAHFSWPGAAANPAHSFTNICDPNRRLVIGYVSRDFRVHSCANFLLPLIEQHDRNNFHVIAFSGVDKPDEGTETIRSLCDSWVDVGYLSDQDFRDVVRSMSVDILVDCSGHTSGARLSAFQLRPAPIQVSWLGYPNTTGLSAMDVKLTDSIATPVAMAPLFSEKIISLPGGFHTYRPVIGNPEVQPVPSVNNGYVTFGAFHNRAKMSDEALNIWSSVLREVSGSRLLVKSKSFFDSTVREAFEKKCVGFGMELDRVETRSWTLETGDHFADFADIDVALDATPYNGTTTTCEALWMGVPVVTLLGDRPAGRVSASLLKQIKHPEWIAEDDDGYVRIAQELAADQSRLVKIRNTLRSDLLKSSLGDANKFARSVEDAYRSLWRGWCEKQASASR